MENGNFPTSRDIYLEVNGRKLAVVEGYKAHSARESHYVEAFGSAEPVGTVPGKTKHFVELSRVYACEGALDDGVSFFELSGFNLVIVKPDRRIIYSGCEDVYKRQPFQEPWTDTRPLAWSGSSTTPFA